MTSNLAFDSLSDMEMAALSAALSKGEPEKDESEDKASLLDGMAHLSGLLQGDQRLISSLVEKPRKITEKELYEDPTLLDEYLISQAYSKAEKGIPKLAEGLLQGAFQGGSELIFGDDGQPKPAGDVMCRIPDAEFFEDPLRWFGEKWSDLETEVREKIDEFTEWENLATLGVGEGLDFAAGQIKELIGLKKPKDEDPASAHITAELLNSYLMPEIKGYLKKQVLGLLKDQFPESLANLKEQEGLLERLKQAAGMESDAGCVPVALRYDAGAHGGSITSPCATSVVAGAAEIAVARQGDGFACTVHLSSNPIKEGIQNILVEGLPITAHKLHTTCDNMIIGTAGHNVFVADSYPLVNLPPNEAPSCSAPPSAPVAPEAPSAAAIPAGEEAPKAKPKPAKRSREADSPAPQPAAPQLSPEKREELRNRFGDVSASIGDSKDKASEWFRSKQDLAALQSELKDQESMLEAAESEKRKANEDLMLETLSRAPGGDVFQRSPPTLTEALIEANKTPIDRHYDWVEKLEAPKHWEKFIEKQQGRVNELRTRVSQAQERENRAAAAFDQAFRDTVQKGSAAIFTPLDRPASQIRERERY